MKRISQTHRLAEETIETIGTISERADLSKAQSIDLLADIVMGNFTMDYILHHAKVMEFIDYRKKMKGV